MRHQKAHNKMGGKNGTHRRAALSNMAVALFTHERITTTLGKAKQLRTSAEKLITLGKRGDLHARRTAAKSIHDHSALQKLFGELADRYEGRPGGYIRILKLGNRRGDNAPTALVELVDAPAKQVAAPEVEETATAAE